MSWRKNSRCPEKQECAVPCFHQGRGADLVHHFQLTKCRNALLHGALLKGEQAPQMRTGLTGHPVSLLIS